MRTLVAPVRAAFPEWAERLIRKVFVSMFVKQFRMGEIVFEEKSEAKELYLVRSGVFSTMKNIKPSEDSDEDHNITDKNNQVISTSTNSSTTLRTERLRQSRTISPSGSPRKNTQVTNDQTNSFKLIPPSLPHSPLPPFHKQLSYFVAYKYHSWLELRRRTTNQQRLSVIRSALCKHNRWAILYPQNGLNSHPKRDRWGLRWLTLATTVVR